MTTARQIWEGMLTELSKVNAPSMLLQDFNYFLNKAVNQYINKRYNIYDINQQTTDDLRVLKATAELKPTKLVVSDDAASWNVGKTNLFGGTYEVYLPLDYLHMLNCICVYKVNKRFKCYNAGDYVSFAAKRLTSDSWSIILNDYYNRPLPWRPYYYIHNVNTSTDIPTNPIKDTSILEISTQGTDASKDYLNSNSVTYYVSKWLDEEGEEQSNAVPNLVPTQELQAFKKTYPNYIVLETISVTNTKETQSNLPRTISLQNISNKSLVEREAGVRYGNKSSVRCEIRYGRDDSLFELVGVYVDYIKAPQTIRLTQEQVDLTEDTSQIMEFPDYVCQEITNELTMLVMENTADPRLQTNTTVSQSIANPAQQQTQPQQRDN